MQVLDQEGLSSRFSAFLSRTRELARGFSTRLEAGDSLVLYTDGITEAESAAGEEFGIERLEELCREHGREPLQQLGKILDDSLREFVGGEALADDRTVLILRRSSA